MGGHKVQSANTIDGINNEITYTVSEIGKLRNEGENYQSYIKDEIAVLK